MLQAVLYLNTLLNLEDLENTKIRFMKSTADLDVLEEYQNNPDIIKCRWLFWRTEQRYFQAGQTAIGLVQMKNDVWLLATIKKITKELDIKGGINYEGEEIEKYSPYFGRLLIKFHKDFQAQGRYAKGLIEQMEVLQLLPTTFDGDDFPGYDKIHLSYQQLKAIIVNHKKDWVAALQNQKAVYLIQDTCNGKLYVGSATGDNGMLLQRWSNYVDNGHGGNVELRKIVEEKGFEYVQKFFHYSVFENYNAKVDKHIVLSRESWWKETLGTRTFGFNAN